MPTHAAQSPTRLVLGRDDDGRMLSADEFADAEFLEPWRYERVAGRLCVMAPDRKDHVLASSPWLEALIVYKSHHAGVVRAVVPNAWVLVPGEIDRIGDIGVYLGGDGWPDIPGEFPDLMFEVVSPSAEDRRRDYVEKRAEYARLGIREYVVIDRFRKVITVFELAGEEYAERLMESPETYTTPLLPGLAIPLAEVLGR